MKKRTFVQRWLKKVKIIGLRIQRYDRIHPKRKYGLVIVVLVLFIWCPGLSNKSIWSYCSLSRKEAQLDKKIHLLRKKFTADSIRLKQLQNNPNDLEHIAREDYLMKSPGEIIFLIKSEKPDEGAKK